MSFFMGGVSSPLSVSSGVLVGDRSWGGGWLWLVWCFMGLGLWLVLGLCVALLFGGLGFLLGGGVVGGVGGVGGSVFWAGGGRVPLPFLFVGASTGRVFAVGVGGGVFFGRFVFLVWGVRVVLGGPFCFALLFVVVGGCFGGGFLAGGGEGFCGWGFLGGSFFFGVSLLGWGLLGGYVGRGGLCLFVCS